jgi:glycosyltransferase involved in cell wall biosynthesis
MIVKDESHIIKGTLEMLCSKINFDYWVICDTGSTDNTPQIITDFFKQKKIKGELHHEKWVDFASNRTSALEKAFKKTDLLFIFDADDEIHGNFCVPNEVSFDEYHIKFGSAHGTSYTRVLLINNKKRFKYFSVIHEFISCQEPNSKTCVIDGDYYVVSGRSGSRNSDPNKYLKDALVLEKAHAEALVTKDPLYLRYAFYCANSYRDCGRHEEAIKWYKITLSQENWPQEKYMSCLSIYDCYSSIQQREAGFFYLVKAFSYDLERVECLYPLLVHYCCENQNQVAYGYYLNVKEFFETKYLTTSMTNKLFINLDKPNFFVPYYMVLIADKVKDFACVIRMYEIVFTKKQQMFETWYVKNFLYNMQFFFAHAKDKKFIKMANEYIRFLKNNGVPLHTFDFLKDYGKYGIEIDYIFNFEVKRDYQKFSKDKCKASKNILFYTGFAEFDWNYSYICTNALGGSEKAVAYLSKNFPGEYKIYVTGAVKPEKFDNITYVNLRDMPNLLNKTPFHTIICSRYIAFLEMFKEVSFYQYYIWAHDTHLIHYGCELQDVEIVTKWSKHIDGCVCQTQWHADEYIKKYPELNGKIHTINNGIITSGFSDKNVKQPNKFIYSSRTERGLVIVLALWPQILKQIPDAQLVISTYTKFPGNPEEERVKCIIDQYPDNIKHLGQLNTAQLYKEMSSAEYWLYPSIYPETSCITALEMLMSEVICLYYPFAGLPYTMKEYGIQINRGNELEKLFSLTSEQKAEMRTKGRQYAESCSWENRGQEWSKLLKLTNDTTVNDDDKWWIYGENYFPQVLEEYKASLKTKYNLEITDDFNVVLNASPKHVSFIFNINEHFCNLLLIKNPNCKISYFNLEPLNLDKRRAHAIDI